MNTPLKTCTKCGKTFPATTEFFHKHPKQSSGLHPRCKLCRGEERKLRHAINGDKARAQMRVYAAIHSQEAVQRVSAFRLAHPDDRRKFRARHRDRLNAQDRQYAREHHAEFLQRNRNRRARVRGANGSHTIDDIHRLFDKQGGKCAYCGASIVDGYHVDHIIPLARGGSNDPSNLALACPPCNLSKGTKLLSEWLVDYPTSWPYNQR